MAYKDYSDERKQQVKDAVKTRRRKIRHDLVQMFGGKCAKCGYDKCEAALEFHHLDPTKKDFQIGTTSKRWDVIVEEANKCIMVCANCHREIHNGV